jgi:hypothetical protein
MSRFKANIIWQSIILIISGSVLGYISSCSQYPEIGKDILVGIFSAILLLLFIEIRDLIKDNQKFGTLAGSYKRLDILNADMTATSDTKYKSMRDRYAGVNSVIKFKYRGDRKYEFEAEYEEGRKKAIIHLDATNPTEGKGVYQYITKKPGYKLPDIGYFQLQVDTVNPDKLYLYHNNLVPSGLAQGLEIWEKQASG